MAILRNIKQETKTVSFRLPAAVVQELEEVKKEAKEQGLLLDLTEQVEKLISGATKQARIELADAQAAKDAAGL